MKKTTKFFALLFTSLLFSCASNNPTIESDTLIANPIRVNTEKVMSIETNQQLTYSGTIEALQTIPLTFQSPGIVDRVYVEEGEQVKKGQLLAEVERGSLTSAYQGALSQYERAIDAQNRLQKVYENGSLPEIKWVEINNQVTQAKSMLEISERNLENCELRAPSSGIIGERNIEPGMAAIQLEAPLKLVKLESILVKISVPENEISQLKQGQTASIMVSALNDHRYIGTIKRVGVAAHRISRTYEVKIEVVNDELLLKPGMVCEVSIQLPTQQKVIQIPLSAIDRDTDNQNFVFIINRTENHVTRRIVKVGDFTQDRVIIVSGLKPGELIVTDGNQKLTDHSQVIF